MNLTDDEILKFQKGAPVFIQDICAVYPATLGEIVDFGYSNFQECLSIITAGKPAEIAGNAEVQAIIEKLTDFEYLLMMTHLDKKSNQMLKQAFQFFIHDTVTFSMDPAQIIVGPLEQKHILTEEKFYDLQELIRRMYFLEEEGESITINKNDSEIVKRLKMQAKRNREKLRRAKAKQAQQSHTDLKLSDLIGSITINNCGLNMDNIWNITYYAFHDQLRRMGWRDQFDTNSRAALAGAKLKKNQLKHWMRSIADSDKS